MLVIFGRGALIFFWFESSWKNIKNDTTFVRMRSGDHLGDAKCSKKAPRSVEFNFFINCNTNEGSPPETVLDIRSWWHTVECFLTSYKMFLAKAIFREVRIQQEKWVVLCLLMYFGWEQWSRWRGEWRNVGAKKLDGENTKNSGIWSRRERSEKMTKQKRGE